jgi:hypothetical protein
VAENFITLGGQRIKVTEITDYQQRFVTELFDDQAELLMDRRKHSDFLAMCADLITPTLPKRFYRKAGETYYWLGSMTEFAEFLIQLSIVYWQGVLAVAKDKTQATQQIQVLEATLRDLRGDLDLSDPGQPPGDPMEFEAKITDIDPADLQAEISRLQARLAASA